MDLSEFSSASEAGLSSVSGMRAENTSLERPTAIVGIGASAGGLEALESFFSSANPTLGLSYLVVMHLDPSRKSLMASLLQKCTSMKVQEGEDGAPVLPNMVYTIPSNRVLELKGGILTLSRPKLPRGYRDPVNSLFLSLAENLGAKAVGIVLSGTGMDGTRGAQVIRNAGGTVLVQTPSESAFDGMPSSVIQSELASMVGTTSQLAEWLSVEFPQSAFGGSLTNFGETSQGTLSLVDESLDRILDTLTQVSGTDFGQYRRGTLLRRVRKRLNQAQARSISDYCDLLRSDPAESSALLQDVLINVTGFFRDSDCYSKLRTKVVPVLLGQAEKLQRHIRVWVAGCSTGEEAYSLAMLLSEEAEKRSSIAKVHIFATDLDPEALELAREGIFSDAAMQGVSAGRRARFFSKVEGGFQVVRKIRDSIVFAPHNLTSDAPLPKMHLISCRNVLIYFESELQKRVLEMFRYSLGSNATGFLFLGQSEGGIADLKAWEIESKSARIFRTMNDEASPRNPSRISFYHSNKSIPSRLSGVPKVTRNRMFAQDTVDRRLTDQLLERVLPKTFIVSAADGVLLSCYGGAADLLTFRNGLVAAKLRSLLPQDLGHHVSALIQEAVCSPENSAETSNVLSRTENKESSWDLKAMRIEDGDASTEKLAITFIPTSARVAFTESLPPGKSHSLAWYKRRVSQLEVDLERAHSNLDAIGMTLERSAKEFEESNHELASLNEELQTSAEELETSKEELQSINEELQSVNSELQIKVSQLAQSNDDLNNLLNSSDLAIIFLDASLSIKRSTRPARELLRLSQVDSGRHISHLDGIFDSFDVSLKCAEVMESNSEVKAQCQLRDGKWYSLKISPYRNHDDTISGLTLCLTNITELKTGQELLSQFRERASALVNSIPAPLLLVNLHRVVIYCNPGRENLGLFSEASVLGKKLEEVQFFGADPAGENSTALSAQVRATCKDRLESSRQYLLNKQSVGALWFEIQTVPCGESDTLIVFHDISLGKQLENRLNRAVEAAELSNRAKTDFLATVSHELRTPLNAVLGFAELLNVDFQRLPDHQKKNLLEQISQSGKILLALVNDLLELARIDSGKLSLTLQSCELGLLIRESANLLQMQLRAKDIRLELVLLTQELELLCDKERVKQILINLIGNAIKFSPHGGKIRIKARVPSSEYVEISVEDSGPGISEELRVAVFERFFRGNGFSDSHAIEGTGLGLAIVKGLVEAQKGNIQVTCPGVDGRGTSFRFTLPLSFE
jgi:two-component system, chemotaxis family, CheB/CheR fusion protein